MRTNARKTIRLPHHDYSSPDDYFVTICTKDRECLLGNIINDQMVLNGYGLMVEKWIEKIPDKFSNSLIDEYIIMPNHVHIIISIINQSSPNTVGADPCVCPSMDINGKRHTGKGGHTGPPLPKMIQWFKTTSTNEYFRINKLYKINFNGPLWQRNYYERIIRNEYELNKTREYIQNNPYNWQNDRNYR